jgi:hypothetical protein
MICPECWCVLFSPPPSVGSGKAISGAVTEMDWGTILYESQVSSKFLWDNIQLLWQNVLQN